MKPVTFAKVARVSLATSLVLTPALWWARATDNFRDWRGHPDDVTKNHVMDQQELASYGAKAKSRFTDVIKAYAERDRKTELTLPELALAKEQLASYEKLSEARTESGFYAAAFRDHANGNIIVAIAGADMANGGSALLADIDDMVMSTTGAPISQLEDAQAFVKSVEAEHGKINYVTGHSLGGHLALYLIGSGALSDAQAIAFDAPGVSHTLIRECAQIGNLEESQVKENLKERTLSVTLTHNSYNTLGAQPGVALTRDNKPNGMANLFPREHVVADGKFAQALNETESMVQRSNDERSPGPGVLTGILLFLSCLAMSPEMVRGGRRAATAIKR